MTATAASAPPQPTSAAAIGSTSPSGSTPALVEGPIGDLSRRAFKTINRWFMLPLLRAGLGAWMGTPVGGWILLLRVRGRKSGLVREQALSYLVADGSVWVMAGFGRRTEWYRNLLVDPRVEVRLPGRALRCRAEVIDDPRVRVRIIPRLARAAGLAGYLIGVDPCRASPLEMLSTTAWLPLIRLRPELGPISPGPDDPGGLGWVWRQGLVLVVGALLIRRVRGLLRS